MSGSAARCADGFTLVELMIVVAVGAILLTIAVPSFQTMIQNNRLVTTTNLLVSNISLARSEAAKRSVPVIMCNSSDPSAATPACDGTAKVWTTGWFVFADNNRNSAFNSASDTLIRRTPAPGNNVDIRTDTAADDDLRFNPDGSSQNGALSTFALCDARGAAQGRQIRVNVLGRPSLTRPAASCTP